MLYIKQLASSNVKCSDIAAAVNKQMQQPQTLCEP